MSALNENPPGGLGTFTVPILVTLSFMGAALPMNAFALRALASLLDE